MSFKFLIELAYSLIPKRTCRFDNFVINLHYSGLLIYPNGPLNPLCDRLEMSEMFRPFQTLLIKIK